MDEHDDRAGRRPVDRSQPDLRRGFDDDMDGEYDVSVGFRFVDDLRDAYTKWDARAALEDKL